MELTRWRTICFSSSSRPLTQLSVVSLSPRGSCWLHFALKDHLSRGILNGDCCFLTNHLLTLGPWPYIIYRERERSRTLNSVYRCSYHTVLISCRCYPVIRAMFKTSVMSFHWLIGIPSSWVMVITNRYHVFSTGGLNPLQSSTNRGLSENRVPKNPMDYLYLPIRMA